MSALDWVYPPKCMTCRNLLPLQDKPRRAKYLCAPCEALFEPLSPPVCGRCGCPVEAEDILCASCRGRPAYFTHNRAAFAYGDLVREIIHEIKFRGRRQFAEGLGVLWAGLLPDDTFKDIQRLIPVPIHPKKKRRRGFNQAEVMARALSAQFGVPLAADTLLRTRDTPPQSGLNREARAQNMAEAFRLHPKRDIFGVKICLIDDIYTTGATLSACAKTLADGGAAEISCMTFSVTVKNNEKV